jgi:hypothetical protein
MIGKRGSGKTYNVIREVIKVGLLPDHAGYTSFVIVSDKDNDSTINEQKNRIKLKLIHTNYNNATKVLNEIKEAKTAYDQVIRHNLQNKLTEDSREEILSKVNDKDFYNEIPCSIILLDDAMNTLKLSKYEKLVEEIFRSRQPRFTIFLCAQDYFGIPCSIRRNLDSFWLFGGFADKKYFNRVFSEVFSTDVDEKIRYWEEYKDFSQYEALYIDFHKSPLKVEMIHK